MLLDTVVAVETPEGIGIGLHVAGPVVRFYAFAIDFLIRAGLYLVCWRLLILGGDFGLGLFLIAIFAIEWFYAVPFEVLWHGQTPGKRALKIRVLREDGLPVRWSESITRNLLRAADFLPGAYGFGLVSMLIDRRFRRLGDLAAGTIVVYQTPEAPDITLTKARPAPPPRRLSVEEQRALVSFAERRGSFTPERARELAGTIAPWLNEREPDRALDRLERIAAWIQRAK